MDEVERLFKQLPQGVGLEWTGLSYQERQAGSQTYLLYGISVFVVFLLLAALYESWSIPLSVMLVIPLGIVGAILAATLRGLYNDIYFQVGLLTTMGLAAKNAILIVEFAVDAQKRGESIRDAALEGARLRLRPILMTSLAFIAGVLPLALANGAGAASQNDIGTGVIGGMLSGTALAIFFVPLFYEIVRERLTDRKAPKVQNRPPKPSHRPASRFQHPRLPRPRRWLSSHPPADQSFADGRHGVYAMKGQAY